MKLRFQLLKLKLLLLFKKKYPHNQSLPAKRLLWLVKVVSTAVNPSLVPRSAVVADVARSPPALAVVVAVPVEAADVTLLQPLAAEAAAFAFVALVAAAVLQ